MNMQWFIEFVMDLYRKGRWVQFMWIGGVVTLNGGIDNVLTNW